MSDNYSKIQKKLVQYYQDLLIVQYHNKPKAKATIKANVDEILCNMLDQKVKDSFDVDTAVGKQLDIIGKWVGVSRIFKGQKFDNRAWFSMPSYNQIPSIYQHGFSTYETFGLNDGGFLTYEYLLGTSNLLNDDDFRLLIKLKIIKNSALHSPKAIDEAIFKLFKGVKSNWAEVLSDKTGYNNVVNAKHSTFDKTKFAIVGNPTISANGTASGFNKESYIKASSNIDLTNVNSLKIEGSFVIKGRPIPDNGGRSQCVLHLAKLGIGNDDPIKLLVNYADSRSCCIVYPTSPNGIALTSWQPIEWGKVNKFSIALEQSRLNFTLNGVSTVVNNVQASWWKHSRELWLGNSANDAQWEYINGSIDLKALSITTGGADVFNREAFTVVGAPTITDNGIVRFDTQGQLIKTGSVLDFEKQDIDISCSFIITKESLSRENIILHVSDTFLISFYADTGKLVAFSVTKNPISIYDNLSIEGLSPKEGDTFNIHISVYKNNAKLTILKNNSQKFEKTVDNYPTQTVGEVEISISDHRYLKGSIDLKTFSISVDGKEVFSGTKYEPLKDIFNGNKQGIDIIKPDNFTKVGNPVISDDGVARGFSYTSYIKTNYTIDTTKPFYIYCSYNTTNDIKPGSIVGFSNLYSTRISIINKAGATRFALYASSTNTNYDITYERYTEPVKLNTKYILKLCCDTENIWIELSENGGPFTEPVKRINLNGKSIFKSSINIGSGLSPETGITGSIDLNAFKIYVDGNLVYQPLLRIPYTLGTNNVKIVDNAYKDRLVDVYNYEDIMTYYSIDEDKETYTRPTSTNTMYTSWKDCMEMNFNYNPKLYGIVSLGIEKQCFPIPTGVKANFVEVNNDKIK